MDVTPDKMLKPLVEYIKAWDKKKRIAVISGMAGVLLVILVAVVLMNRFGYVTLYNGLSASEAGEIVIRLNEMGVESKLRSDGTILVPRGEEDQLKMSLATEGYPKSALNYDIFSSNSGYMTTDYEKKQYLLFQLQNRLQDAIKTLDSVESAIVTISLPEDNSYVLSDDEVPATASVVLDLSGHSDLSKSQIKGIQELVAKSVTGLEGDNVAIVDSLGNILNETYDGTSGGAASTRIDLESSISQAIEKKIATLFQPLYGADAIRVAVSATVDIRKSLSEETTYTPVVENSGVVSQQDLSKDVANSGAGSEGVAGSESNTGVPVYPNNETAAADDGVVSSSSSTDYLVNTLIQQIERDGYEIQSLSAAVLINSSTLTQDQITSYKDMVSKASGIVADNITIAGAKFAEGPSSENREGGGEGGGVLSGGNLLFYAAAGGAVLLLLLLLLFLLSRRRRKRKAAKAKMNQPAVEKPQQMVEIPKEIVITETREQGLKRQIQDLSSTNPDIVAQLLRTWIKEDENDYE